MQCGPPATQPLTLSLWCPPDARLHITAGHVGLRGAICTPACTLRDGCRRRPRRPGLSWPDYLQSEAAAQLEGIPVQQALGCMPALGCLALLPQPVQAHGAVGSHVAAQDDACIGQLCCITLALQLQDMSVILMGAVQGSQSCVGPDTYAPQWRSYIEPMSVVVQLEHRSAGTQTACTC